MRVGRALNFKGGFQAEQVENRSPGASLAGCNVADVAAGDVYRHDGGGAVVGVLRAFDRCVEVVDQLLGFGLLAEYLTEVGDFADEFLIEGLPVARF